MEPRDTAGVAEAVASAREGAIARGMGRSYGDAAQLSGGAVIGTTRLKGHELDAEGGTVTAWAGSTIGELLSALVPLGWIVPVLPGTQHVSVAGAVASDIHGKNHGTAGTFGSYVDAIGLVRADGELVELERGGGDGLLEATIGGMGLTGVIVWARFRLRPVRSAWLAVDTDRTVGLDGTLAALREPGGPHRVAWLDLLSGGPVRAIVTRAEHLDRPSDGVQRPGGATVASRATVPRRWPAALLRTAAVRGFNELRFRTDSEAPPWASRADRRAHVPARRARRVATALRPARVPAIPAGRAVRA